MGYGVDKRLKEHDVSCPAVQEVEALVGDSSHHAEDGIAATKGNSERRECEGEDANAVGEASEPATGIIQVGSFDGGLPNLVRDTNKGEDGKVSAEDGEDQELQSSRVSKNTGQTLREKIASVGGRDEPAQAVHEALLGAPLMVFAGSEEPCESQDE